MVRSKGTSEERDTTGKQTETGGHTNKPGGRTFHEHKAVQVFPLFKNTPAHSTFSAQQEERPWKRIEQPTEPISSTKNQIYWRG